MEAIEIRPSTDQLLAAIEQLPWPEMNRLTDRLLTLRAARRAPHLSADETALFARINRVLLPADKARLHELIARREAETLTAVEQPELIELTDRLEELHADRVAALATLAQMRGVTLAAVMEQLGIRFPDHD